MGNNIYDFDTHHHTICEEDLNNPEFGGTIADLMWEAHKVGKMCYINGKPAGSIHRRTQADCDREWMESHSVMGEIPQQNPMLDAIDNYFDSIAI